MRAEELQQVGHALPRAPQTRIAGVQVTHTRVAKMGVLPSSKGGENVKSLCGLKPKALRPVRVRLPPEVTARAWWTLCSCHNILRKETRQLPPPHPRRHQHSPLLLYACTRLSTLTSYLLKNTAEQRRNRQQRRAPHVPGVFKWL